MFRQIISQPSQIIKSYHSYPKGTAAELLKGHLFESRIDTDISLSSFSFCPSAKKSETLPRHNSATFNLRDTIKLSKPDERSFYRRAPYLGSRFELVLRSTPNAMRIRWHGWEWRRESTRVCKYFGYQTGCGGLYQTPFDKEPKSLINNRIDCHWGLRESRVHFGNLDDLFNNAFNRRCPYAC